MSDTKASKDWAQFSKQIKLDESDWAVVDALYEEHRNREGMISKADFIRKLLLTGARSQLVTMKITAALVVPGSMVGPVQLARIHWSPETSVTMYDSRVIGVLPLFWRDNAMLVAEGSADPVSVNDSGSGSTTFTVRIQE